ncbi:MAG: hypothetical protein H7210_08060 [Pyrinomonadaceae bacterium]|nr:hypothetical protein [Phycisphaerales bacterium]
MDNARAMGGKAILVSLENGYGEFDIGNKGAFLNRVNNKSGISGACRMPDGNTALGQDDTILIVSATGAEVRRIAIPLGDNLRAINRNPETKSFWLSKTNLVYEISEAGTIKWMGNIGSGSTKGYAVWWTGMGGAWATTGEPSTIVEVSPAGMVVPGKTIGGRTQFAAIGLDFFSGFVRVPSTGNFVVANWLGHPTAKLTAPHLVEFTPQNTVAWQWGTQTEARQITNVYIVR